jgi:hypothetical protein
MRLFCEALWAPKAGNAEEEYEDAYWPKPRLSGEIQHRFCVAVADGATDSSFSGIWAKKLVRAYCKGSLDLAHLDSTLPPLQQQWDSIVRRKKLPWYAEEKARDGAFSTLLGLALQDEDERERCGSWNATAVGDSCLAHVRGNDLLSTFPISDSAAFGNSPLLISSNAASNKQLQQNIHNADGTWDVGDTFYLMTDAIAAWFFRESEAGHSPWMALRDLETDVSLSFRPWIDGLRKTKAIRNDDITLYRIEIT